MFKYSVIHLHRNIYSSIKKNLQRVWLFPFTVLWRTFVIFCYHHSHGNASTNTLTLEETLFLTLASSPYSIELWQSIVTVPGEYLYIFAVFFLLGWFSVFCWVLRGFFAGFFFFILRHIVVDNIFDVASKVKILKKSCIYRFLIDLITTTKTFLDWSHVGQRSLHNHTIIQHKLWRLFLPLQKTGAA